MSYAEDEGIDIGPPDEPEEGVWVTREGEHIKVRDMEDRHLLNTIAMLERRAKAMNELALLDAYEVESTLRGEMALFSIEQDIRRLEAGDYEAFLPDIYELMIGEKERRGLA